jgi:hypothetical protein
MLTEVKRADEEEEGHLPTRSSSAAARNISPHHRWSARVPSEARALPGEGILAELVVDRLLGGGQRGQGSGVTVGASSRRMARTVSPSAVLADLRIVRLTAQPAGDTT